jgi:GTP cyclohydrolase II
MTIPDREATTRAVSLAAANLPIHGGRDMKIIVIGRAPDHAEVVALVHKTPNATDEAVVRIHSACLTGDTLLSAKCDCGAQLRLAIDAGRDRQERATRHLLAHPMLKSSFGSEAPLPSVKRDRR